MSVDLRTRYLGLELRSPVVASSSPLTGRLASLRALEDAGVGAVVLPSLFEEQIDHVELHPLPVNSTHRFTEAATWFPRVEQSDTVPELYLAHVRDARAALDVPVIASLSGVCAGDWIRYARLCQESGADAVELNVDDVEDDVEIDGRMVEERTLALVRSVRGEVSVPVAVKLGPFYSSFAHMAASLVGAGADGLVLFNRFVQPEVDPDTMSIRSSLRLSSEDELLLALRWVAVLRGRVQASLAGTGGVHGWRAALKLLLAGADVAMTASAVIEHGPSVVAGMIDGLERWMTEREYASVEQLKGSLSREACREPDAFDRVSYMRALTTFAPAG